MTRAILVLASIGLSVFGLSLSAYDHDSLNQDTMAEAACNSFDREHIFKTNYNFAEAWKGCSSVSGLDLNCFRAKYPADNMSTPCLECFAQMTSCSISNCAWDCMFDGRAPKCRKCSVKACGAQMTACSGVDPQDLPDFRRKR